MSGSDTYEVVIQQPGFSLEVIEYSDFEEMRSDWANFELALEGSPSPDDILIEESSDGWFGVFAGMEDTTILSGFHSMEEIVQGACRFIETHGLEGGNIWAKSEGQLFLLG